MSEDSAKVSAEVVVIAVADAGKVRMFQWSCGAKIEASNNDVDTGNIMTREMQYYGQSARRRKKFLGNNQETQDTKSHSL